MGGFPALGVSFAGSNNEDNRVLEGTLGSPCFGTFQRHSQGILPLALITHATGLMMAAGVGLHGSQSSVPYLEGV